MRRRRRRRTGRAPRARAAGRPGGTMTGRPGRSGLVARLRGFPLAGDLSQARRGVRPGCGPAAGLERGGRGLQGAGLGRGLPGRAGRGRRRHRDVRQLLNGTGQHVRVGREDAAQPRHRHDQRRSQPGPGTSWPSRSPAPPWPPGGGGDAGRRGRPAEGSPHCRLPGQLTGFGRPGQGGEHTRQVMHRLRRVGGEGAPSDDHVQQRLVVLAAGPAGGEPRHLTLNSVPLAQCVTPARSARSASRRRARWAVTRTAPGVLPTIRATSAASSPATTRSMMISA